MRLGFIHGKLFESPQGSNRMKTKSNYRQKIPFDGLIEIKIRLSAKLINSRLIALLILLNSLISRIYFLHATVKSNYRHAKISQ